MNSTSVSAASTWLSSAFGRKLLTALTGLFFVLFLVVHLSGNLLLFKNDGGAAFNTYARFMSSNGIVRVLEVGLFAGILGHIVLALLVNARSRGARKSKYAVYRPSPKVPLASRFMVHTGLVVLVWLVLHLYSFFFQRVLDHSKSNVMYDLVKESFASLPYVIFYVLAMILMAFHTSHGVFSGFQTLGIVINKSLERGFRIAAWVYAVIISAGFASIPLYFYFVVNR